MAESGIKGYEVIGWFAVVAPTGTSPEIIQKLNQAIALAVSQPTLRAHLMELGNIPFVKSPSETHDFIASELKKFKEIVLATSMKNN